MSGGHGGISSTVVDAKSRHQLYRLMISQLFYDGYQDIAIKLSNIIKPTPACPPSDKLAHVVAHYLDEEDSGYGAQSERGDTEFIPSSIALDLDCKADVDHHAPEPIEYETGYVTSHKGPVRAAAFSPSGNLAATGSEDSTIKILDVDRMLQKWSINIAGETAENESHPVIRTLYDHTQEVTCVDFHPTQQILASGSKDLTIKLFDFSRPSTKKAYKTIMEAAPVRTLCWHPTGDYLVVGTHHPVLRLYDIQSGACFVSPNPADQHRAPLTAVKYSLDAKMMVSSSKDGDIRLWDGVSSRCINTFRSAHDGNEVSSVTFSKNSKYVLSCGKDSMVKLWELSTSRCLVAYTGAGVKGKMNKRTQACFNHTEDYVFFPDEATISLCSWDSRNAERQRLLGLGHNAPVRRIVHSPSISAFVSCSEDAKSRFWCRRQTMMDMR